jgi:hypothetical protein
MTRPRYSTRNPLNGEIETFGSFWSWLWRELRLIPKALKGGWPGLLFLLFWILLALVEVR